MHHLKTILFISLGVVTAAFVMTWARHARRVQADETGLEKSPTLFHTIVALVCTFFDTLGIGNFAPTTSAFKFRGSVLDERIPGTLNVGYAIPTIAQAYIFISAVDVIAATLETKLPLDAIRWLVVIAVTCAAATMLRSARR